MIDIDEKKLDNIIKQVYLIELAEGRKNTPSKAIIEMHKKVIKEKVDAYKED